VASKTICWITHIPHLPFSKNFKNKFPHIYIITGKSGYLTAHKPWENTPKLTGGQVTGFVSCTIAAIYNLFYFGGVDGGGETNIFPQTLIAWCARFLFFK
jgi:hypothetical protein